MPSYNELSRRGLIKLGNDYDVANNNGLKDFLNNASGGYESVRPHEQMIEKLDEAAEKVKIQGGVVSTAMVRKVDKVFDRMMGKLQKEIDRAVALIDEQLDDSSYPSETDDEDIDFDDEEDDG